jgi:tripartite ATP-independent transporter DctM subunit
VNESIAGLFMAGVFPGIMLALLFMGYIVLHTLFRPQGMPAPEPPASLRRKLRDSISLLPVVLLILAVLGSIYAGIATATEAAVLGVAGALLLSLLQGTLTRASFTDSLMGATRTSCMIALILAGAAFLSLAMGFTGLPRHLAAWIGSLQLSPLALIVALTLFYMVLGCFLDGISAVVLTMAVVEPMVRQAGIDMLWFGIFLVIVVEMAQITPPVGFNLFVLQGMTHHEIPFIARAALPMFGIMVLAVVLVVAFPEIATWLPAQMRPGP